MKQIALTSGHKFPSGDCAFNSEKIRQAGIYEHMLYSGLTDAFRQFALLLNDGRGFAVIVEGGEASIIGLNITEPPKH